MNQKYDAIVVGSGLGGLSAAASLSNRGVKVGLFEKHSQPGGYATSFFRDRFEFEVSLHALSGVGSYDAPGPIMTYLDKLGVGKRVEFLFMEDLYRTLGPDVDFTMPKGKVESVEALCEAYPHEARGIRAFFAQVFRVGREVELFRDCNLSSGTLTSIAHIPNLAHSSGMTVAQMLNRHVTDPKLQLVLTQLWGYFGLPPSQLSFMMFCAGVSTYIKYGSATLRGKSQSLSNAFVDVIRENGGDVHLSCGVSKIVASGGRVKGVVTEHGDRYAADVVVSNADAVTTMNELMDLDQVPPAYRRRLDVATPGVSALTVYMGLSRPSREVGLVNHEVYLNNTLDSDAQWQTCQELVDPGMIAFCSYDHTNPDFAPPGKGVAVLTALSQGDAWTTMDPSRYDEEKERIAQAMLDRADAVCPGIRSAVETAVVATPVTHMRYTGNRKGAVYGFACTPQENPGFRVSNQTPVKGLWLAGAWTRPGGGYQTTIMSGANAVRDLVAAGDLTPPVAVQVNTTLPPEGLGGLRRRMKGWGQFLRDVKQVGKVVRTNYQRHDDTPYENTHDNVSKLLDRFHAQQMTMRLVSRTPETHDTVTLRFAPLSGTVPAFYAGQYFNLFTQVEGVHTSRPYSISSSPDNRDFLEVTVKEKAGGFVSGHLVKALADGDEVQVSGPYGDFHYNPLRDTADIVGVAVGSGITPFRSILSRLEKSGTNVTFHLVVGARTGEDLIFSTFLEEMEKRCDWLTVTRVLSKPTGLWSGPKGRIDGKILADAIGGELGNKTFFICGPGGLYKTLVVALTGMGADRSQIRLESYGPPDNITTEATWPAGVKPEETFLIQVPGRDEPVKAAAGETVLSSLERAGIRHSAICRSDVCDACTMELVDGDVFTPVDPVGLRTGHGGKKIHICSCYPLGNLKLDR